LVLVVFDLVVVDRRFWVVRLERQGGGRSRRRKKKKLKLHVSASTVERLFVEATEVEREAACSCRAHRVHLAASLR